MGLFKKIKKWINDSASGKHQVKQSKPKQQKVIKSDFSYRKQTKYANRAPNKQKQMAQSAYRAKRQMLSNKSVSSMSKGAKQTLTTNTQKSPVQRFNAGVIKSGAMLGLPSDKGVPQTVKASTSYKAGKIVGTAASYLGGYGGVGKGLAKQAVKQTVKRTAAKEAAKSTARINTGRIATKDLLGKSKTEISKIAEKNASTKLPTVTKSGKALATKEAKQVTKVAPSKFGKVRQTEAGKKLAVKYAENKAAKETVKNAIKTTAGEKAVQKIAKNKVVRAAAERQVAKEAGVQSVKKIAKTKAVMESAEAAVKKKGVKEGTKEFKAEVKKVAAEKAEKQAVTKRSVKNFEQKVDEVAAKKAEQLVQKAKQQAIADATVGTALDTAHAYGEDIKPGTKEYAKYMGESAAMNLGFGVGGEVVGAGAKATGRAVKGAVEARKAAMESVGEEAFKGTTRAHEKALSGKFSGPDIERANREIKAAEKPTEAPRKVLKGDEHVAHMPNGKTAVKVKGKDGKIHIEIMPTKQYKKQRAALEATRARVQGRIDRAAKVEQRITNTRRVYKRAEVDEAVNAVRGNKNLSVPDINGGLKRAELDPEIKSAMEDEGFKAAIKKTGETPRKIAEREGISVREAVKKAYKDYNDTKAIKKVKTPDGAEEELLGERTANVLTRSPEKEKKGALKGIYDSFIKHWVDDTHEISKFAQKASDDLVRPLLDRAKTSIQASQEMVNGDRQMLVLKDGVVDNGESVKRIIKPIMDKGEDYEKDFYEFLYHRMNATYRHEAGSDVFGKNMTKEKSEEMVESLLKKHPEFEQEADKVYNYLDGLNRIEVDSGRMTKEHYEWLKENNPFYVPSYRQKYIDSGRGKVVHGNTITTRDYKGAVGSSSDIAPLHEQLAFETHRRMEASALNDLGYRMMKDMGDDAIVSIKSMDGKKVPKDEILDIEKGEFPKTIEEKDGAYYFNVRGDGKIYKVAIDKNMFEALDNIGKETKKISGFYQANNMFRSLVTNMNPLFAVRNGARDFFDAPSFSQYGAMDFYKNYIRAWKHIKGNSELWRTYKNIGGTSESFVDIAKQWQDGNWFSRNVLQRIERLNSAVEQAPRFAEFMTTLEHEGNTKEGILKALNNAHELTLNFGRHGEYGKVLNANGATFLNAGIQDVARVARVFKNAKSNPGAIARLIVGASTLGIAPSVINELVCGDMEGYQNLRTSEKDLNFLIPTDWVPGVDTDEKFIKIPKGRVSSVFAMPVQRAVREYKGNTKVGEKMLTGIGEDIREQVAPANPITNNLVYPGYQAASKDGKTWYGSPIVPQSMQDKKPEEQYDETTSRLAVKIGKQLGISPKRLEYAFQQYGGVIAQVGKGLPVVGKPSISDDELSGESALRSLKSIGESNFVSDSNSNNGYSNTIYENASKLKMYKDDSKADKMAYDYMATAQNKMGEFSKQIKEIQADENLSHDEKIKQVREVRREQIKVAKSFLANGERAKDEAKTIAKSLDKKDFLTKNGEFSDKKYNEALKERLRLKLDGAKALVAEEDAKTKPGEKTLSQKLKEAGISAEKYYDYKAKGATLAQVKKAKDRGIDVDTFVGAMNTAKGYSSYGERLGRWIDNGYVKDFDELLVYDPEAESHKGTWNSIVWAKNNGMSTKHIAKVLGTDTASDDGMRKKMKSYGTYGNGAVSPDGIHAWIESEYGDLKKKDKALLWKYYGQGSSWFQNRNPYL